LTTLQEHPVCPHCGQTLQALELPDNTGWTGAFHFACFNDDCPYYLRGWEHMMSNFAVKASYRYRVDPSNGAPSPLPVWSANALKDRIIEVAIGEDSDGDVAADRDENGDPT
jgi:hypothetical protein